MTDTALPPDPYTMSTQLCDDDGMVSHEVAFRGPNLTLTYLDIMHNLRVQTRPSCDRITEPFHCTGHAHLAGEHILCTSPKHKVGLTMWSEDPGVYVEPDGTVIRSTGTAGQPSEDLAAVIAYGGGRSENIQVPARARVGEGSRMVLVSDRTGDVLAVLDVTNIREADDGALLVRVARA